MNNSRSDPIERQAIRILFILYFCGDNRNEPLPLFGDYTHYIESESRLQKFDFWIRYPDHLAAALIWGCQPGNDLANRADEVKRIVRSIFQDQEPALRWTPMRRFLRGAYEPLDDLMIFLTSRWLAYRRITEKGHRTCYYLTRKGHDAVTDILKECGETLWYSERCRLLNSFYGHLNGFEIRKIQYLNEEYKDTPYWQVIGRIEAKVRQQFELAFGEVL